MKDTPDLEDVAEQFLEEYRCGKKPEMKKFLARYPEHAAELQELLPLMLEMEGLRNCPQEEGSFFSPASSEKWMAEKGTNGSSIPRLPESDYDLLKKIGSGGMGVVFKAVQRSLNRKVAVKLLSPSLVSDTQQREQFEQEARVIAMLHHPNIVKVFSAESRAGYCYYAMELVDGKGLNQYEFDDLRELAAVGLQAARALAYAHHCKVVHRDVKPANLLLDSHHELHVSDFGIACVLPDDQEMAENPHSQSGTLRYMAPERLTHGINSYAADQYSLGVTLYELVTHSPVLPAQTPKEWIRQICEGNIPPLRCHEPDLAAIINKCIRLRPQDRYACMDDLAEDLQRFLNYEPIRAIPVSFPRRVRLWVRRKPAVAGLSLVSMLCAVAFVVALTVGFLRTSAALKLAEENAAIADAALTDVFEHVETQIPSQSGTRLLAKLMPYYQNIARQRNLSSSRIAAANRIIGTYALRGGNFTLAETAFLQLSELSPEAFPRNQLAEALRHQGKLEAADALAHEIVSQYADSDNPADRFEAVRALLALALHSQTIGVENAPESDELTQAFQMLQVLLLADPKNPEYRFQYALLLGSNPRLFRSARIAGVEPNAILLLNELAEEYPDRPDYGLALVEIMYRKLHYSQRIRNRDEEAMTVALKMSDRLLGRFPNTPKVVSSVVQFRKEYIRVLRKNHHETDARRETERLLGMLEILCYHPEIPDTARECLIQFHLQRLEMVVRDQRWAEKDRLSAEIEKELQLYHGPLQEEFTRQFVDLSNPH